MPDSSQPSPNRDPDPYYSQRQAALRWLGDRYLLAKPVNKKTS